MTNVVKIVPSWELTGKDEEGNMFFSFTTEHTVNRMNETSKKIIKEMESRRKL